MKSYIQYISEIALESEAQLILSYEMPPLFLSAPIFKRVFNIKDKQALHSMDTESAINNFPHVINKAKQVSCFTYVDSESSFLTQGVYGGGIIAHVKGRVTGQFASDAYSNITKRGARAVGLGEDSFDLLEPGDADALINLAANLRKVIHNILIKDLEFSAQSSPDFFDEEDHYHVLYDQLDGKQKNVLISKYIKQMEKLMSNSKYKDALFNFMVSQKNQDADHNAYNEVILDKVQLLALYITVPIPDKASSRGLVSVEDLKKIYPKVKIYQNATTKDILSVISKL